MERRSSPAALEALRGRQAVAMREGHAGHEIVFPAVEGGFQRRTDFRKRVWLPIRDAAVIPAIRFHDLRHTAATLMKAGVPVKVVSEMLGHANITITLGTYAHVMEGMQEAAADAMQAVVAG